jgi:transmembrane sensor
VSSLDGWIGVSVPDVIMDDAAAWLMMLDSDDCNPADRIAFARWLGEDPTHQWAFEELSAIWARLHTLSEVKSRIDDSNIVRLPVPHTTPDISMDSPGGGRKNSWSVLAASLLVIVGIVADISARVPVEAYSTAYGETRDVMLSDGSRVELNAQSKLEFIVDDKQRRLRMTDGEAVFHIAGDQRPFIVEADRGSAAALGTTFSVKADADVFEVTVIDGRVAVRTDDSKPPLTEFDHVESFNFGDVTALLDAGQRFEISGDSPHYRISAADDLDQELSWRQGWVVIDNQPLGRVVHTMRRYSRTSIHIADSLLDDVRVSGKFNIGDVDSFLSLLTEKYDIIVDRSDTHWIILRSAS